jgi:ferredoxin-NADP reductase/nitrite reductase/ring-hydroxylating ferredoxin subunit
MMGNASAFDPALAWFPIAASDDLPSRHTYHGKLLGRELAVWRADDGFVNVWEDRCLHRGVRLSIGLNDGAELKCQYHGWRYASRSAGCTYIPAHPADAPARTICCNTFPAVERYGLLWSGEDPLGDVPEMPQLGEDALVLRAIPIRASAELVVERLRAHPCVTSVDDRMVARYSDPEHDAIVVLFVQPVDEAVVILRGVLAPRPPESEVLATLHRYNTQLSRLRDALEAEAATLPAPPPMQPRQRSTVPAAPPTHTSVDTRLAPLRVVVARKWMAADGVAGFELESIAGRLPAFQPGAHIDVHLQNGLVRQYSLTNGPRDVARYRIGVKLEPQSRGGSSALHNTVRKGDVLAISEPRNNFPLRRDYLNTLLIAGGIGVTPLLAMAQALAHAQLDFTLHYFAQSTEHVAFAEVLEALGDHVAYHLGLGPDATGDRLREVVGSQPESSQLYVCGPGPMLGATRAIARELGWPDKDVHFEYFKNSSVIDDSSSFTVELARSALHLHVSAGTTVLEALAEQGVIVPSSCQQGACGTCIVRVLEGEPDHQDVYLNDSEKSLNDRMLVCVSRAKSSRLVLDV